MRLDGGEQFPVAALLVAWTGLLLWLAEALRQRVHRLDDGKERSRSD